MNKNFYAYVILGLIAICAIAGVSAVSDGYKLDTIEDMSLEVPKEVNLIEQSDDYYESIYGDGVDFYSDSDLNFSILIFGDKNAKEFLKNYVSNLNKNDTYTKISDSGLDSSYHVFKQSTSDGDIYHIIFIIKEIDDDNNEFKVVDVMGKNLEQVKKAAITTKSVDD